MYKNATLINGDSLMNKVPKLIQGNFYVKHVKRWFDLVAVILSFPIWGFILGTIALLIKLSDWNAPVFFTQNRVGRNGRKFKVYKFRTMVPNAEEMKKELMHLNVLEWPDFKIPDDPRITKIGKFLRKTSLDEFPQFINVLFGDMTLVGPRPTSFGSDTYQHWQTERLDLIPGLTGLWQVKGRAAMMFDERVRMEIYYINNCSLGLDIYILIWTVLSIFTSKGE